MRSLSEALDMPQTVGVAGLGSMGEPMARNLLSAGFEVCGHDVRSGPVERLAAAGGTVAHDASDLGAECDAVLVVVQNADQTRDVVLGRNGVAEGTAGRSVTVAICATVPPEVCQELDEATDASIRIVDAPLCRGDDAAAAGELLVLAGGEASHVEALRNVLEAFAAPSDVHHVGDLGAGQAAKAANNVLLWTSLVADVEVFELCRSYGLDVDVLTDALAESSGTNWGVANWTDRYPRPIPWAHEDMRIALDMAERQGITMPTAGLVRERVRELQAAWGGG